MFYEILDEMSAFKRIKHFVQHCKFRMLDEMLDLFKSALRVQKLFAIFAKNSIADDWRVVNTCSMKHCNIALIQCIIFSKHSNSFEYRQIIWNFTADIGKISGSILSCMLHRNPAGIYLLKVNNRNTRARCEICSKWTIKHVFVG